MKILYLYYKVNSFIDILYFVYYKVNLEKYIRKKTRLLSIHPMLPPLLAARQSKIPAAKSDGL